MSWIIKSGVNDGYPYRTDSPLPEARFLKAPCPYAMMHIDGITNDGYPFLPLLFARNGNGSNAVRRLYYGKSRVCAICFGARPVIACCWNQQTVFTK